MRRHQASRLRNAYWRWILLLAAVTFIAGSSDYCCLPRSGSDSSESTLLESCWTYTLSPWQGFPWRPFFAHHTSCQLALICTVSSESCRIVQAQVIWFTVSWLCLQEKAWKTHLYSVHTVDAMMPGSHNRGSTLCQCGSADDRTSCCLFPSWYDKLDLFRRARSKSSASIKVARCTALRSLRLNRMGVLQTCTEHRNVIT